MITDETIPNLEEEMRDNRKPRVEPLKILYNIGSFRNSLKRFLKQHKYDYVEKCGEITNRLAEILYERANTMDL